MLYASCRLTIFLFTVLPCDLPCIMSQRDFSTAT